MNHVRYENARMSVVECPPCCRTINVAGMTYHLAFPWMVFVLAHDTVQVGFRNAELTDADQTIYYPQMLNISAEGLFVCMDMATGGNHSLRAIEGFWSSRFAHSEYMHKTYLRANAYCRDWRVSTPEIWQRHTFQDPSFITTVTWRPYGELSDLLNAPEHE